MTMTRMFNQRLAAAALALVFSSAPALLSAQDADPSAKPSETMVTDFRGRPPFKREFVSSEELVDLARFEETTDAPSGDDVRIVDYRGRPPFKREIVSSDEIADLARFEETDSTAETRRTRRGPPGKMNSRR